MPTCRELKLNLKEAQGSLEASKNHLTELETEFAEKSELLKKLEKEVPAIEKQVVETRKTHKKRLKAVEEAEKALKEKEKDEKTEKQVEESLEYLKKAIHGGLVEEECGNPIEVHDLDEEDLDMMRDEEIIEKAVEIHFYYVLFPELRYDPTDYEGRHIISDDDDCVGRPSTDPEYRSCCHKKYATYVYAPDEDDYNPVTLNSTRDDLIKSGRVN